MRQPRGTARAERSSNLQGESRGAVPLRDAHRSLAVLMATCLALALAASFAACSGAPEERPAPAATAPPAAPQPTATPSPPPVATPSPTPVTTHSPTPVATPSPTPVATVAPTGTPSPPAVATVEPTATPSPTPVATVAPTGTPSPTSFRYDTYDTTGAVAEPGSYAFLSDPADTTSAVTTYEALRDGTTTALLVHKSDAHGASQAALYDAVEAGDLFEWHEADDCFVRYKVTEVKPDPAGAVPRKLLAVEWMTYAFTGCSGAVPANAAATVDWGELPDLGGTGITAPVVHGVYQIVPKGWTGATKAREDSEWSEPYGELIQTTDIAVARKMRHWREPAVPAGWRFTKAEGGGHEFQPLDGYCAEWARGVGPGMSGIEVCATKGVRIWFGVGEGARENGVRYETRVVAGRPAAVAYGTRSAASYLRLSIHDPDTDVEYRLLALGLRNRDLRLGRTVEQSIADLIAIAEGMFEPPNPLPPHTAFRYDTHDTTGAVATAGSYAFLADPADTTSAVSTYEALRDGTTTALLIHKSDAHGASQAALYDAVEAGDLFEWKEADDCFVRYTVMEVKPDPAGAVPRKLLAVEWMTYAFTGCSGAVPANAAATVDWGELPDLGGTGITAPVVHGVYQIVPKGWTGATKAREDSEWSEPSEPIGTTDLAVARQMRHWREPAVPAGWLFTRAVGGGYEFQPLDGYCAKWARGVGPGMGGIEVCATKGVRIWFGVGEGAEENGVRFETRVVAGRPAAVVYGTRSTPVPSSYLELVVHDPDTDVEYTLKAFGLRNRDLSLGRTVDQSIGALIAIAEGMFEPPNPLPPHTAFRYDTHDTTGAVATAGSYAFLSDPADTTTAVTTYEALRDGTTTALLIHKSDAHGASQAALYDAVEAGDLFEWHEADDCFVRYKVTEVKPDPAGAVPRKLLAVEWMTYAFTGCSGAVPANAAATVDWGELPDLGGTGITAPVVHGVYQIVPADWTGEVKPTEFHPAPDSSWEGGYVETADLAEARGLPYWRDLPGWTLGKVSSGGPDDPVYGYCATFLRNSVDIVEICGGHAGGRYGQPPSVTTNGRVTETRVIDGQPVLVSYWPRGLPLSRRANRITADVYDPATEGVYEVTGLSYTLLGGNVEAVLDVVRSLFESTNPQ